MARSGLWAQRDFLKLWGGQSISELGSSITTVALPLTAVLLLHAGPLAMGVLGAALTAPFLLVGLLAGALVDQAPRRTLMIGADAVRFLLLGAIPVLRLANRLTLPGLDADAFLIGCMTVVFDVAYQSYLPRLVPRDLLVPANSALEVSRSVSQVAGPGLGGFLVQALSAPLALGGDALSYAISVASLLSMRHRDAARPRSAGSLRADIAEGLRVVVGSPLLRAIAGCTATANLFGNVMMAVAVLFMVHGLSFSPLDLGAVYAVGSIGAVVGATAAGRLAGRRGTGSTIILGSVASAAYAVVLAATSGPRLVALGLVAAASCLGGFGSTVYNINQVSLRQAITPDRLMGRMNASMRFIVWGVMPLGSLLGGYLGAHWGIRPTLILGALGSLAAPLWVWRSPVRALVRIPEHAAS